jgi:hypothetical protein
VADGSFFLLAPLSFYPVATAERKRKEQKRAGRGSTRPIEKRYVELTEAAKVWGGINYAANP